MKRILVIGRSGAGKTTFADRLGKTLHREVIHLDDLFWKPGWVRAFAPQEWQDKVEELISEDEWILDGNYHTTLEARLQRADMIIFFDFNPLRAFANALNRKFLPQKGSTDKMIGLHGEVGITMLIKSILSFPSKKVRVQIENANIKDVFVVKNNKDADELLKRLVKSTISC